LRNYFLKIKDLFLLIPHFNLPRVQAGLLPVFTDEMMFSVRSGKQLFVDSGTGL
jgi:hypothetical protein